MVDINTQILNLNINEAEEVINRFAERGYTDLILTIPILKNGSLEQTLLEKFFTLKKKVKTINLYLGNEIFYHYKLIYHLKNDDILTLNNSNYILLHLRNEAKPIQLNALFDVLRDFKIIISCIDNYKYYSYKDLLDLKKYGALFLIENEKLRKKKVKKLLRKQLVDFIASYDDFKNSLIKPKFIKDEYFNQLTTGNYQKIINLDL